MQYDIEEVKRQWEACEAAYSEIYTDCRDDWEFLHGINQWDGKVRAKREKQGSPCLTLNNLLPYANQVVNDITQANIAIRVSPVDDKADIDTANVYQGIIRNIEKQSKATNAYSMAALNAVGAGVGWVTVRTEYAKFDTFDQEIYIDRVLDFESVYLDPSSKTVDGSDAEFGFIRVDYTKEAFEEEYPDAECVGFCDSSGQGEDICVVEYFRKYYKSETIYQIALVNGQVEVINQEQKDTLDEDGTVEYAVLNERKTKIPYVKHCILNGEDDPIQETDFPSIYIPIVPVYGKEVYLNGQRELHSLIRQAKDPQKMFNYWKSSSTEMIALQPKTPWIAPVGSFNSTPDKWANANNENYSTLEYDLVYAEDGQRAEPPQRSLPAQGSPAMMQEAMGAREDIRLAIGMPQANMGERGTEVSGIAIRNRQIEGDNATYHFINNLAASITQLGCILVDMIPRVYSERKIMRILGEDGAEKNIPLGVPFVKEGGQERPARQGEEIQGVYDLNAGKYDVVCDIGASYSSKRQEMADKLIELINAKPEIVDVTGDLLFKALDLPMGEEIAKRIKSQMPSEFLADDPMAEKLKAAGVAMKQMEERLLNYQAALEEKKGNEEFEQAIELKKVENDTQELQIKAAKTQAEIEKMRAETTGFNVEAVTALGNAVQGMAVQMEDIGGAVEEILNAKEQELMELEASDMETATPEVAIIEEDTLENE